MGAGYALGDRSPTPAAERHGQHCLIDASQLWEAVITGHSSRAPEHKGQYGDARGLQAGGQTTPSR